MLTQDYAHSVSITSQNFSPYVECGVVSIASEDSSSWDFIHVGLRSIADQLAGDINNAARISLVQELECGQKLVEAKKTLTRRGEFAGFRAKLLVSLAQARKAMRVFDRFGNWSIEKLLTVNSVVNIYTLCQSKFDEVVQKMVEATELTKTMVQRMVKEVRDKVSAERKSKRIDPVSGWRQDPSEGGRYYQLPAMYNEQAAIKVEQLAQERNVMPLKIVEEAIACFETTESVNEQLNEQRIEFQSQLQSAVSQMRDMHLDMQRQILQRDTRIADLEAKLADFVKSNASRQLFPELKQSSNSIQPSFQLELQTEAKFAVGDRVIMVEPWPNGDRRDIGRNATVKRIAKDGRLAVHLDNSRTEMLVKSEAIDFPRSSNATSENDFMQTFQKHRQA